jgi:transmembrane sensor
MKAGDSNSDGAALGRGASIKNIRRTAAEWLAKREAGEFTLEDRTAFAKWCAVDPRHAAAFSQVESSWRAFDRLAFYPGAAGASADPDFFAAALKRPEGRGLGFRRFLKPALLAAAAAAIFAIVSLRPWTSRRSAEALPAIARVESSTAIGRAESSTAVARAESPFLHLPDGSEVELKAGSEVAEDFTPSERRVRLLRGEANFTVAKNPARPFIVEAGPVAMRAVGTAFDVSLGTTAVEVLVIEGVVQVHPHSLGDDKAAAATESPVLTAGQRTILPSGTGAGPVKPIVETLTAPEIDRALAWQTARLAFDGTPLAEVVERFNRHTANQLGAPRLVLGDPELGTVPISGRIRPDSIDSFVEVLETNFGVTADRRADGEIILRKSK